MIGCTDFGGGGLAPTLPCQSHESIVREQGVMVGQMQGIVSQQAEILKKLEGIADRQITLYEHVEKYHSEVLVIQGDLNNGLRGDVQSICEDVQKLKDDVRVLNEFAWFREAMQKLRTRWFLFSMILFLFLTLSSLLAKFINEEIMEAVITKCLKTLL